MTDLAQVQETPEEVNETEVSQDTVQIINVDNPSTEEMEGICEHINVNYNGKVVTRPVEFKFKTSTDKETNITSKRNPVDLAIPFVSVDGIIAILEKGGKELALLMEATDNIIKGVARDLLYDDVTYTASTFPVEKLDWEAIANMPPAQRKGGGIPKETWDGFGMDYIATMPEAAGKDLKQVGFAAKLLVGKFANCKTNTTVLGVLVQQLGIYANASPNFTEYSDCVEFLLNKADTLLNVSEADLLANL